MPHIPRTATPETSLFPEPEPDPAVPAPAPPTPKKEKPVVAGAAPSPAVIPASVKPSNGAPLAEPRVAPPWTIASANAVYNIDRWGEGYFSINEKGNVAISPQQAAGATIDITDIIAAAKAEGLEFPLVIRFQDIVRHRVAALNEAFASAISENKYRGQYFGVFPIKVNQLREVVEEIVDAGRPFNYGLEAGSKPELTAALAIHDNPGALLICNGYKDKGFIRLALLGVRLGKKVILVAEKLEEIRQIIEVGREMGVEPMIGIRIRLVAKSSGKWAESAGVSAKFGLTTSELVDAVDYLRAEGKLDCLKLVHFHIGSQIPNIAHIKKAVREATRYYGQIVKLGAQPEYIDVGGGLGVDYDGSKTDFHSSTNYTLQEYANDIVYNIMDICDAEKVPHPHISSESGRAVVAHHALMIGEVFGAIEKTKQVYDLTLTEDDHKLIRDLAYIKNNYRRNPLESFHDITQIREEAQHRFELGILDLRTKARVETFFWHIAEEIVEMYRNDFGKGYIPEDIRNLETHLADQYLVNFSVFQSLPDHWAVGQVFPIMPVHRLLERPQQPGSIVDITCDSDGKVTKFAELNDVRETIPFHTLNGGPYYLGFFMIGAYQDIMGDLHNLFGRVNEIHIFLDPDEESGYYIEETIKGNTIGEVLEMTQYNVADLNRRMKQQVDAAIREDRVKPSEGIRLLNEYEATMLQQTYLRLDQ
jgi:arginine decarboxylase